MRTPAELRAHISLELRVTDTPKLTYDDWTTIKRALETTAPAAPTPTPIEKLRKLREK